MNLISVENVLNLHKPNHRLAGLDLGTKTIGVALSDGRLAIASASHAITRAKFGDNAAQLIEFCDTQQVFALVVGLPLNMDGSEGPRAQASRAFARNWGRVSDLPVLLWDERLSTVAAERAMIEADMSRKKRAEKIDSAAAAIILQGALDRLANLRAKD